MLLGFIAALVFAIIFSAILGIGFRRRGPGPVGGLFYFFLLILFFTWATGIWLHPYGPLFWNVPWLNFLVAAFFIMLLIAVLVPPARPVLPESKGEKEAADAAAVTFGLLFWILIIALILIAFSRNYFIAYPGQVGY